MNFLLVVPKLINKPGDYYMFPSGIAYVSAVMKQAGYNLFKLNLNNYDSNTAEILKQEIESNNIHVVLTGGLTGQYGSIRDIVETTKLINAKILVVVGGGIISSSPLYAMEAISFADFGVIGEGENTICALCNALIQNDNINKVPGVIYKKNDTYFITEGGPKPVDIDLLPFPDYDGFGIEGLFKIAPNIIGISEENTFQLFTSRSCPFNCTFCFHSTGRLYRQHHLDRVFDEIDYFIEKYEIRYLSIQDELFGYDFNRVKEFCKRIKPYNLQWFAQFRVTDITQELVEILKDANCATIGFGIESADNSVLKSMNKKITIEDTNKALELVFDAGIGIQGCLIFGDIVETTDTIKTSLKWWKEHIYYGIQLSVVVTYPGTYLFDYAMENGLINDPVKFIKDSCPTVRLSQMTNKEYSWMLGQILLMQRISDSLPKKVISTQINYNQKNVNMVGTCRTCNHENIWDNIKIFVAESLVCEKCGRRHYSPIPEELVEKIIFNLSLLIKKYNTIYFWGINSYFYGFCEKLSINKKNLRIVDKSEIRHGMDVYGIEVQSTDIIKEQSAQCVVVAVPQYYSNLLPMIKAEFPHLKKVLNILDLM